MYNQPENEPEIIYAVVQNIPYEGEYFHLYTFDLKKAQKKLEELKDPPSSIEYEIMEIKVEK